MIFLPFIISGITGFLLVSLLLERENAPSFYFKAILGIGLGLGISSHTTFFSFLFFDRLIAQWVIGVHLVILCILLYKWFFTNKKATHRLSFSQISWQHNTAALIILAVLILVIKQGLYYPYGGWDAWQVWNFKAKFLFLAGEYWHNLFSPDLWRSSPHYPLLLPLINVWGWLFTINPTDKIPFITSILFTVLTAGLLSSALWEQTNNIFSLLPGLLLLSLPFFNLLATTQYCDIVLSFYLLAAITTLGQMPKTKKNYWALLSGLFAGFLSFTKPEGLIAALILAILVFGSCIGEKLSSQKNFSLINAGLFCLGLFVTSLPTFAFNILYSPGNQTFINGLTSILKPATWERFQIILEFLAVELLSKKWNGLWILFLLGLILGGKTLWAKNNKITAGFLLIYLTVIIGYYQLNTYFEIKWWLAVSLNRILFSLLPLLLYWIFGGILPKKNRFINPPNFRSTLVHEPDP